MKEMHWQGDISVADNLEINGNGNKNGNGNLCPLPQPQFLQAEHVIALAFHSRS